MQLPAELDKARHPRQLRIEAVEQATPLQARRSTQQLVQLLGQQRVFDQHIHATRHQRLRQGRALLAACRAAHRHAGQAGIVGHLFEGVETRHLQVPGQGL
ncbi:hypothetical protein D3C79_774370 [compost metagenome]